MYDWISFFSIIRGWILDKEFVVLYSGFWFFLLIVIVMLFLLCINFSIYKIWLYDIFVVVRFNGVSFVYDFEFKGICSLLFKKRDKME